MKRFDFRLQRVLDIKSTIEKAKNRDFMAAYGEFQKAVNKLQNIVDTRKKYQINLYNLEKEGIEITSINFYIRYFGMLENQISYQHRMINIAKEEMEKRRLILLEAVKERKILERLKEKKREQFNYEIGKEEQMESDEISGMKFFHEKNDPNSLSGIDLKVAV